MESVRLIVGVILPYVALLVFLGGMIWRISTWKKMASPPITLFPAPPTEGANTVNTVKEVLFFKSLFAGDRVLWVLAWGFHVVLALIFLGHFRVVTGLIDAMLTPIIGEEGVEAMSAGAGGAAGVVILVMLALLLIRRMTLPRVREITGGADVAALLLIAVIVITGDMMRFGGNQYHGFLDHTREYFVGLATFSSGLTSMTALEDNLFLVHMFLALMLIMLIPFSKILHFGGIFFTHQLIRKNS